MTIVKWWSIFNQLYHVKLTTQGSLIMNGQETINDLKIRKVVKEDIEREVDSSSGLSCNGTVHEIPTKDGEFRRVFLKPGDELPLKYKKSIVKYSKSLIAGLKKKDRKQMMEYVEQLKEEIEKN